MGDDDLDLIQGVTSIPEVIVDVAGLVGYGDAADRIPLPDFLTKVKPATSVRTPEPSSASLQDLHSVGAGRSVGARMSGTAANSFGGGLS
ncbi:hypothetical protein [Streptomyces sp. NPDC090056]|uniref:hypothetical protein n=1 Tax=Streptomyces sp. NPDC090056 TaxID=3365934 RepID=UPI0037F3DFE3